MSEKNNVSSCPMHGCGCVGYAYVPIQYINDIYSVYDALENGTLFPELNLNICEYGYVCKEVGGER